MWLATSKGICSIDKKTNFVSRYFKSNTNNKLLSDKINSIFYYDKKLYIGTDKGLNYLDLAKMEFSIEKKLNEVSIQNFDVIDNHLMVFTKERVLKKAVSYTHLRAHETPEHRVLRLGL